MNSKTRFPLAGTSLTVIATVHTLLGIALLIGGEQDIEVLFWFTAFGVVGIALGLAMIELERARGFVPLAVLIVLAVTVIFGIAIDPLSGFLTLLIPLGAGGIGWWRARTAATAD